MGEYYLILSESSMTSLRSRMLHISHHVIVHSLSSIAWPSYDKEAPSLMRSDGHNEKQYATDCHPRCLNHVTSGDRHGSMRSSELLYNNNHVHERPGARPSANE